MGKTTRFLADGEDFSFPSDFGFSGSVAPKNHPTMGGDEFGDGTYLSKQAETPTYAKGGKAQGGPQMPGAKIPKAGRAIIGALALGKQIGQAQAATKGAPGVNPAPPMGQSPLAGVGVGAQMPSVGALGGGAPGMKKGGKVRKMADGEESSMAAFDGMYDHHSRRAKKLADGGEISTRVNGKLQTGHVGKDGNVSFDDKPADWYTKDKWHGSPGPVDDAPHPTPRPAYGDDGMGPIERDNYAALKANKKGFSDDEARYMATNPAGRLAPDPDAQGKAHGGKFIQSAIKHPGALHKDLGVPQGQKIPASKLEAAAHKPGKVGQRARFAETLKGMHPSKKG